MITQSLAATRRLMEMCRRQLHQPSARRTLDRLEHRLDKIVAELSDLQDPAM